MGIDLRSVAWKCYVKRNLYNMTSLQQLQQGNNRKINIETLFTITARCGNKVRRFSDVFRGYKKRPVAHQKRHTKIVSNIRLYVTASGNVNQQLVKS